MYFMYFPVNKSLMNDVSLKSLKGVDNEMAKLILDEIVEHDSQINFNDVGLCHLIYFIQIHVFYTYIHLFNSSHFSLLPSFLTCIFPFCFKFSNISFLYKLFVKSHINNIALYQMTIDLILIYIYNILFINN